jgi:hypothetical protein
VGYLAAVLFVFFLQRVNILLNYIGMLLKINAGLVDAAARSLTLPAT